LYQDLGLRAKYGITLPVRDRLLELQGGICACCGTSDFGPVGPCVEHDHVTEKIRGIVCKTCNLVLSMMGDDIEGAMAWGSTRAVHYLRDVARVDTPRRIRQIIDEGFEQVPRKRRRGAWYQIKPDCDR
jgi:Recombination endonuclease VII